MARELTTHPETGELVEVVHQYQVIDLNSLKADVEQKQATVDALTEQANGITNQLTEAQAALEDSKSDASRAEELVGSPVADGLDAGAEAPSSDLENTDSPAEDGSQEVAVHFETPSF